MPLFHERWHLSLKDIIIEFDWIYGLRLNSAKTELYFLYRRKELLQRSIITPIDDIVLEELMSWILLHTAQVRDAEDDLC